MGGWTCVKCKTHHKTRNKIYCDHVVDGVVCGRKQPKKAPPPAHRAVLSESYEFFVEVNGGNFCWIGRFLGLECKPTKNGRFARDHDHKTGRARGLLCFRHNKRLLGGITLEEATAVKAYLDRSESLDRGMPGGLT